MAKGNGREFGIITHRFLSNFRARARNIINFLVIKRKNCVYLTLTRRKNCAKINNGEASPFACKMNRKRIVGRILDILPLFDF